jgi:ligand-binding sensor domain-containing protein
VARHGESLYRFDGVRFERFVDRKGMPLPASDITALKLMPNGDIWVGYYQGGLSRIHDSEVTTYTLADGLPHPS